jgi:tRNA A37 methylthiotransferase MiaB
MGDPVRSLSVDTIRKRLDRIREQGIRDVRVLDRTFNHHPQRAIALMQLFAEYHPHMRFHLEMHPALLPQSVRDVLASMPGGLLHLEAGIQSLRHEVLEACTRKGSLAHSLDGLRYLCSLPNVVTHADLIAGLPLYTLE